MKRVFAVLAVLVFATAAFAQSQQGAAEGIVIKQTHMVQDPAGAPPPPNANFMFFATESFGGKVVKNAPYSAEAVTERIQVLGDGNRIVNKYTSTVYRDSEGRTRREQTLQGLGGLATGKEPLQMIFINDPVAGVTYSLESRSRIAHKSTPLKLNVRNFEFSVPPQGGMSRSMIMAAPLGEGAAGPTRIPAPEPDRFTIGTSSSSSFIFRRTGPNPNEVKENLGKQSIEGVEAEGTRTTITIPAGEIGNERPIEIVSERWYSPELQLVVMTRDSDPRSGETTYKLTNINRTEPARSLFEVPSDYTVRETLHQTPLPMPRIKKLANPEE